MSKSYIRKNKIAGQFSARTIEMLESPAFQILSLGAHRALARLEIEHAHHGGNDNGRLPVTFDQFVEFGIHRHAIAPALREISALGFAEITERGRAGNAEWRRPHKFRLTYRQVDRAAPTDEWKRFKTKEQAEMVAQAARRPPRRKNKSPVSVSASFQCRKAHHKPDFYSAETITTGLSAENITTSISRHQAERGSLESKEGNGLMAYVASVVREQLDALDARRGAL
jgi:hypothetical protein